MSKVKLLTYSGLIPVLIYMLSPEKWFNSITVQALVFNYTCMIIVFLSGIHWHIGLQNKKNTALYISVCIMLISFVLLSLFNHIGITAISWLSLVLMLSLIYTYDHYLHLKKMIDKEFISIRKKVTVVYCISLIIISLR